MMLNKGEIQEEGKGWQIVQFQAIHMVFKAVLMTPIGKY